MPLSPLGLLEIAATGEPVSAAQVAAAVDSPKERAQLRSAVMDVSALRQSGANRDSRRLAAELASRFAQPEEELEEFVTPGELADAVTGARRPMPPAAVGPVDPHDPGELASSILDRRRL